LGGMGFNLTIIGYWHLKRKLKAYFQNSLDFNFPFYSLGSP